MPTTDPRTTIRNLVDAYIAIPGNEITNDAGVPITTLCIWEGGPETLYYLFYGAPDAGVVITFGNPRSSGKRNVQDVPVHYLMRYPITVTTVDKPLTGALVCTAVRMQYKATYAIRMAVAGSAQSGVGATPAYTLTIREDSATHKRVAGLDLWEATHFAEYETDYA